MTFKRVLFPVAIAWGVLNLVAAGFAMPEPLHALVHVALALGFGLWAQHLRRDSGRSELNPRVEVLEDEISELQRELNDAQQGLDFAERLLAERPEPLPVDPQRYAPKQPDRGAIRRDLEEGEDPSV